MKKLLLLPALILGLSFGTALAEEAKNLPAAPDLSVETVQGGTYTVPKEGAVILAFANTSCSACKQELKVIKEIKDANTDKLEVVVFYADMNKEKVLVPFVERANFPFVSVWDGEFKYAGQFGFSFTPATVIIKDGKIVEKKSGWQLGKDEAPFKAKIMGLL